MVTIAFRSLTAIGLPHGILPRPASPARRGGQTPLPFVHRGSFGAALVQPRTDLFHDDATHGVTFDGEQRSEVSRTAS